MPVYKAFILSKEISVNYEENEKAQLVEAIHEINSELATYDNLNGKVSDSKLLSFLAIKLQAELIFLKKNRNKMNETKNKNIGLNDKIYKLNEENKLLKEEIELMNSELKKLQNQIEIIIKIVKKTYEE